MFGHIPKRINPEPDRWADIPDLDLDDSDNTVRGLVWSDLVAEMHRYAAAPLLGDDVATEAVKS